MSSSLRTTSWLRAALRCSHMSVSAPGGVWFFVCLVCPVVPLKGILLLPHVLILGWGRFPLLEQGKISGERSCGPPSWLHSLSRAVLLLCIILPFAAILLLVSFNSLKDTFLVGITLLYIQPCLDFYSPGLSPFFLEMGFLKSCHSVLWSWCRSILWLPCNQVLWSCGFSSWSLIYYWYMPVAMQWAFPGQMS